MPRYFVDIRTGCAAVRDRELTSMEDTGLHEDMAGVVRYWHGVVKTRVCKTCGHRTPDGFTLPQDAIDAANKLCKELNERGK